MRSTASVLLTVLLLSLAAQGLAATLAEPISKTIENTYDYAGEGYSIHVDQWLYQFKNSALRFFVADAVISDPTQLQTAFAGEAYSRQNAEKTSDIAARHNAVLAVNGDYYNYRDDYGMVIRNGVLYRDKASKCDQLLIYADGHFETIPREEYAPGHGEEYIGAGVVQSFSFGPTLIEDGEIVELARDYVINTSETTRNPRTGIGIIEPGHYVFLVADGRRKNWSDKGMALQEMQLVFKEMGCRTAYNLDGGGSSTLVVEGEKLNRSSGSHERDVSDIVYLTGKE